MNAVGVAQRVAEIVRAERSDAFMTADVLRALHAQLGCVVSAARLDEVCLGKPHSAVAGAPEERLEQYTLETAGLALDPLLGEAIARRAPVHDGLLFRDGERWRADPFYTTNGRRFGTEHYLVIPLLGAQHVVGTLHLSRSRHAAPFGESALHLASLVGAHVSVALGLRGSARRGVPLAFRELQVARMAARGLDNGHIAANLGLARETVKKTLGRAYAKLGIRSRAEMAAELARSGRL